MFAGSDSAFFQTINRVNADLGVRQKEVLLVIVVAASLVVAARVLGPFELRQDQSLQLEAAQRLRLGLGLSTTRTVTTAPDVMEAPSPIYLTDWPPALSLLVAGLLLCGLSLEVALKVMYAVVTLGGWVGWGLVANYVLAGHFSKGAALSWIYLIVSALLPVLYTPWWGGTDVFLWAGVPYVVLLLFLANYRPRPAALIVAAGLLFGLLCSMRYASFFLAIAASLILLQTTIPDIKAFLRRSALFFIPSLIFIVPVFLYVKQYRPRFSNLPSLGNDELNTTLIEVAGSLSTASVMFTGFPWLLNSVKQTEWLNYLVGAATLLAAVALPAALLQRTSLNFPELRKNFSLSLAFLPLSVLAFLVGIAFVSGMIYLPEQRYFQAVGLVGVLLVYEFFMRRAASRALKTAAGLLVVAFVAYSFVYLLSGVTARKRADVVHSVLSFTPSRSAELSTSEVINYPQQGLYTRKEGSRKKLQELSQSSARAIFFIQKNYQLYVYDNTRQQSPVAGLDLRLLPAADYWRQSYTSQAVDVYWVLEQSGPPADVKGNPLNFVSPENLKIVYHDAFERTTILKSEFPAGYRFSDRNSTSTHNARSFAASHKAS